MSEQAKVETRVVMTLQDLQSVLNYVATRPYSEVFQVVETLKKSKTLESVVAESGYIKLPDPIPAPAAEETTPTAGA